MARITTLVLALVALLAAGCGGDDDDNGDSAAPATQTQAQTAPAETTPGGGDDADTGPDRGTPGSRGGSADENGGLTRAEFIERADRICGAVRREIGDNGAKITRLAISAARGKTDPKVYYRDSAKLTEASAEAAGGAVDRLEALPRPTSRRDALERYLAAARDQVEYLADQAEALAQRDQAQIAKLNQVTARTGKRVRAAAHQYGFEVCGGG